MLNRLEYYPLKSVIGVDLVKHFLATSFFIWYSYVVIITPEEDYYTTIRLFKWIFHFFGKKGIVIHHLIWTLICSILLFIDTNAIIRCIIVSKRFLPFDWEERKKIVWKERKAFPKEITAEMLKQIMKVTDLPQQQVKSVLYKRSFIPEGIIVFPDLRCYKYVPVYFENKNYYLYKTNSVLIFSVMNKQKKLISYRVEQSEVDFVYKCEKLANDIRNNPLKYEDKKI